MTARRFFLAAVIVGLLQTAAVGAMIYDRARHIETGWEVVIESGFVDPRDLFRGHYVTLNPVVGDLRASYVGTDGDFEREDTVYVELEKGEGPYWTARKLWHAIPDGKDAPFLAGRILAAPVVPDGSFSIRFPIDRYFAERERARDLEKLRADSKLGIVLALDADGKGYVKGLMVDGESIYDEPLY